MTYFVVSVGYSLIYFRNFDNLLFCCFIRFRQRQLFFFPEIFGVTFFSTVFDLDLEAITPPFFDKLDLDDELD